MPLIEEQPDIDGLSVRDLRKLLRVKGVDTSKVVEKGHLRQLAKDNVQPDEVADILSSAETSTTSSSSSSSSSSNTSSTSSSTTSSSSGATRRPVASSAQRKQQVDQMRQMSTEQMRYQAACMKRDPASVRRSNPGLAGASDEDIRQQAGQFEMMANMTTAQREQAFTQMENMTPEAEEIQRKMMQALTPRQRDQLAEMTKVAGSGTAAGLAYFCSMDDEQLDTIITLLKVHESMFSFRPKRLQ
jgi:hypothetical protein